MTLILGMALAGCGGPPENGGRYESAVELRDAVVKAGLECPAWDEHDAVETASSAGTCSDNLLVVTYGSEADKQEQMDRYDMIGKFAKLTVLVGENWSVMAPDSETDALQEKLGGTVLRTPGDE